MENEDILTEILLRMPLKSLMRFICVSKRWSSIICEKPFRDLYLARSMTKPRMLFKFCRNIYEPLKDVFVLFHSVHQEEEPLLSSGQQKMRISLGRQCAISGPIRGLVCLQSSKKVQICNPGTKKIKDLPEFREDGVGFTTSFFGYDKTKDVFKVLCRTNKVFKNSYPTDKEYRILTVGSVEESWRPVVVKHIHFPVTNGLCKDGVVYYGAWRINSESSIVMSFNVSSEEFSAIELPEGVKVKIGAKLVNYNGEIALHNVSTGDIGEIWIWIRNEISGEWREEHIVIPGWIETVGDVHFSFVGTTRRTGELVFTRKEMNEGSHSVLFYDTVKKIFRMFPIEGPVEDPLPFAATCLDHVDSPWIPM